MPVSREANTLGNLRPLTGVVRRLLHPRRWLYGIAAAALGIALLSRPAGAQVAPAKSSAEPELQEIVVTGSLIKRTDTETPSPVQVITNIEMQQSGYTNVSDVLRNLSASGQGQVSQSFNVGFAAGAQGVALRGLTVGDTLVLIDGKRMASYPLTDDNERSFTDISAIPFNAIERVEVLKDGASAIYGADAIAGVVNIILKKSFTGTEVSAEGGTSEKHDATSEHLAVISGMGDLNSDGYNAYIAVDFHHQDEILAANRSGAYTTQNWSSIPGGLNTTPGAGNNPYGTDNGYPLSISGYLINPYVTASNNNQAPQAFLPGCTAAAQAANGCTFSINGLQIQPPTEQINVLGKFTKAVGNDWKFSVTASVFNSQAAQVCCAYSQTDYGFGGITNIGFGPGAGPTAASTVSTLLTVPANYPGNPYGVAAPLIYSFHELGIPQTVTDTNTYRLVTDIKGSAAGWDIDGSLGAMYARMNESFYGSMVPGELQTALNNGYMVGPNASSSAAISMFAPPAYAYPTSTLDIADIHGSRPLFDLPGGPVSLAIGSQFFHKVMNATAPASIASGYQDGDPVFAIGSQNDAAVFTELDAQVFKQLETDAAVRYDHYNDGVGGATTPKFSVKYKPIEQFALRGTWGRGFRAPSPAENGESGSLFGASGTLVDPALCPHPGTAANPTPNAAGNFPTQCAVVLTGYQEAGTNLKPVTSTNETFGFIFEPAKAFNVSVDYYQIVLKNDIISQSTAGMQDYIPGSLIRGPSAVLPFCTANNVCTANENTPVGLALFASYPYINAGATKTEGIDVDMQTEFDLGNAGKLSAELNYTHIYMYDITIAGVTYSLAGTHGPSGVSGDTGNPKDRAVFDLTWEKGPVSVSGTVNYTGSFSVTDPSSQIDTCLEAVTGASSSAYGLRFSPGVNTIPGYLCQVRHFTDVNLYARYVVSDHLAVHGSIDNLFNADPPLDMQTYGGGAGLAYDGAFHEDGAIGRFFTVGATYKF